MPNPSIAPPPSKSKIDPRLLQWLADSSLAKVDTLVVTYVDTVTIAHFPELDQAQEKNSVVNMTALAAAQVMITNLEVRRAGQYTMDSLDLVNNLSGALLERYWITQALRVTLPLGMVDSLAARPNVVWIQLDHTEIEPPAFADNDDNNPDNDPAAARIAQASDPLFNQFLPYGWISVLDTGVLANHELFNQESAFERLGDCVDGDLTCSGGSPKDVTSEGHGTATCAILVANSTANPRFRGVTSAKLDVFRVYRRKGSKSELVVSAAVRGFQTATARLDRIIVAEMQDTSAPAAAIADAAEGAFDAGATIIAANGNFGTDPAHPKSYPACARRVIGVGARAIDGSGTLPGQSYGLTEDRRQKPDLQATSMTETAGAATTDAVHVHTGTSGATPYAAGAAALLRNWLTSVQGSTVDPGQVYAQLILSSTNRRAPWPPKEGVGQIVLPSGGFGKFGKVELTSAYPSCTIPVSIPFTRMTRVDVALWWPEGTPLPGTAADAWHNDVNFTLFDPTGAKRASGENVDGVYERSGYDASSLQTGTWILKIDGKQFRRLPQVVYWTVGVRL